MNLQPTLEDGLIILRPLYKEDYDALYTVAKDPLIWEQHPCPNRYKKEDFSAFFEESIQSKGALVVIDKSNNTIIGSSRYKSIDGADNAIEIGWSFLSRAHWGGKYNKAMKVLMIDHAFQFIEDVVLYIDDTNLRSQKAAEKIGAQRIIDSKKHLLHSTASIWTYCINKNSWKTIKEKFL